MTGILQHSRRGIRCPLGATHSKNSSRTGEADETQIVADVILHCDCRIRYTGGPGRRGIELGSDQARGQAQIRRDRLPAQLVPRQSERQVDRLPGRDGRGHRQGDERRSRPGRDDLGELCARLAIQQDRLAVRAAGDAETGIGDRFRGPRHNLYWYAVNLQKVAPKATRVELNDVAATALAVTSGRADAMVTAVFGALVAKNRNPDLGDFVLPTPTVYLPSYAGLRREDNNTFQKFLQAWAEWNNLLGYTEARIRKYLESAGATSIPENVRF